MKCKSEKKLPPITSPEEVLRYECRECCKIFKTETEVREHAKTHKSVQTGEEEELLGKEQQTAEPTVSSCDQDTQVFDSESSSALPTQSNAIDNTNDNPNSSQLKFTCEICGIQFASEKELMGHAESHSGNTVGDQEVTSTSSGDVGETCKLCFKHLKNKKSLHCHMYRHGLSNASSSKDNVNSKSAGDKDYATSIPRKDKASTKPRKDKESTKPTSVPSDEEQEETCTICSKKLKNKKSLECHMWRHTSGKTNRYDQNLPFKCSKCRTRFGTREEATEHFKKHKHKTLLKNHDNVTPDLLLEHQCQVCGRVCKNEENLKRHQLRHKSDDHESQEDAMIFAFTCVICRFQFKTKQEVINHSASHAI